MNYTYKYQFHSQGKYAVVDAYYRNIWFSTNNEQLAHKIKQTFRAKLNAMVLDLSVFDNFDLVSNHINSANCLNWHIPRTNTDALVRLNPNQPKYNETVKEYPAIDLAILAIRTFSNILEERRAHELHDQILLYSHILEMYHNATGAVSGVDGYRQAIDNVFATEIDLDQIEIQLADVSRYYFGLVPTMPGCVMATIQGNFYE